MTDALEEFVLACDEESIINISTELYHELRKLDLVDYIPNPKTGRPIYYYLGHVLVVDPLEKYFREVNRG